MGNYTEKLKQFISSKEEGRKDYFDLTLEESIANIKSNLKNTFSINLWTYKMPEEQIKEVDKKLSEEKIIHCWDEISDSFVCFNSYEDMIGFFKRLREGLTEEQLELFRKKRYNTPVTRWFEKVDVNRTSNKHIPEEILKIVKDS